MQPARRGGASARSDEEEDEEDVGPLIGAPKNRLVMGLWPEGPQPLINHFVSGAAQLHLVRITAYFLCNSTDPRQRCLCRIISFERRAVEIMAIDADQDAFRAKKATMKGMSVRLPSI